VLTQVSLSTAILFSSLQFKEMAVDAWGRDPGLTKTATPIAQAGYGAVYLYG
jgi:hypothetical protein